MRRWIVWSLSLLLLLTLCACGQPQQTEQTGQQGENPQTDEQEPEEPAFDPLVPESEAVSADWFHLYGGEVAVRREFVPEDLLRMWDELPADEVEPWSGMGRALRHQSL